MAYSFTTQGSTPRESQRSVPNTSDGSTPAERALNNARMGQMQPPVPLIPPTANTGAIKSHSITHPDGTVVTQTFHNPEQGMLSREGNTGTKPNVKSVQTPAPEIKVISGMHHVPFKASDGSVKYVNAKGEIS